MRESRFQAELIKELKDRFQGCIVLKNDAGYIQGFPDLTILYRNHWAVLEVKANIHSPHQPNQDWYVATLNDMSFAAFIYPENKEAILDGLESAFSSRGQTRVPKRKQVSLG